MIHWMKIDTDPDDNLLAFVTNAVPKALKILCITRQQFTPGTWGYLIVYEDPA